MRVLVTDPISQLGIDVFKVNPDIMVDIKLKPTEDELIDLIGDYDALVVRSETKVTKRVIDNAHKLKVIGRAGVGIDNIDVNAAKAKGIIVVNTPGGNTIAAAEHTFGLILALARHVPQAHGDLKKGKWNRSKYMGTELRTKTLGILGLGRIGKEVAKFAQAFGMNVIAYDPYAVKEQVSPLGVKLVDFNELLQQADFLTVHMPLTSESRNFIAQKEISLMKEGACIVNCARGGIVSETALYNALIEGKLKGAALDVFETEPSVSSPLFELEQVIATPHLGASTREAQVNVAIEVCRDIVNILQGDEPANPVFSLKAKSA